MCVIAGSGRADCVKFLQHRIIQRESKCQPTNISAKPANAISRGGKRCPTLPSMPVPHAAEAYAGSSAEGQGPLPKVAAPPRSQCAPPAVPAAARAQAAAMRLSARTKAGFDHPVGEAGNRSKEPRTSRCFERARLQSSRKERKINVGFHP